MTSESAPLSEEQIWEADRLAHYLIGTGCPPQAAVDYFRAIDAHGAELTQSEAKAWGSMLRSRLLLRSIDAGLALTSPASILRKRIFIMLCILETEPSLADQFLPRDRPWTFVFVIGVRSIRAVMAAIFGIFLVKWMAIVR